MPRAIPENPSEQLVRHYLDVFHADERYFLADKAILELVEQFRDNTTLQHILLKVTAINDLYGTNIYATFKMAHHIHTLRIDPELATASTDIVDKIAAVTFSGKPRNVFSFASKYCSWHDPQNYPLYDYYVEKLLLAYRRKDKFAKFKNADLRKYGNYKNIVSRFRDHYQLGDFSFKELDKFLWLFWKGALPKNLQTKRSLTRRYIPSAMKMLPPKIIPFTPFDGLPPLHKVDQTMMRRLGQLAHRRGWSVEHLIHEALEQWMVQCQVGRELETKIIRFPKQPRRLS